MTRNFRPAERKKLHRLPCPEALPLLNGIDGPRHCLDIVDPRQRRPGTTHSNHLGNPFCRPKEYRLYCAVPAVADPAIQLAFSSFLNSPGAIPDPLDPAGDHDMGCFEIIRHFRQTGSPKLDQPVFGQPDKCRGPDTQLTFQIKLTTM